MKAASDTPSASSSNATPRRSRWLLGLLLFPLAVGGYGAADWWTCLPDDARADYVGRQSCVQCHTVQAERFHGSHHDRAMDLATPETVLGDFNNAELTHYGTTSRMFQRDGKYFINTEGPDGKAADFEIKYVFGVDPLQQYMVEFDRSERQPADELPRVQVLRVSWDVKNKRWFHLDPPDVKEKLAPDDDLHWTGIAQRWNTMCADCHSTNLKRNYDPATGHYHTTFSEIDVSCEACHGPGGLHEKLARTPSPFWDRKRGYAITSFDAKNNVPEVETCAPCHSRRRIVHGDFRPGSPLLDFFEAELLVQPTYHADGQNLDEVYEYGSFVQSKMFHKNIRCSDCHEPHSAKLRFEGNKLCTSCHAHPAGKYDTPAHHQHAPNSKGASCVECHMPETTYMAIDARRDHGLRVPRPDLSLKHKTPNACSSCHINDVKDLAPAKRKTLTQYADWLSAAEKDEEIAAAVERIDRYCAEAFARWYPKQNRKEDAVVPVFTQARTGDPAAREGLRELARKADLPAIMRATALAELSRLSGPVAADDEAIFASLRDRQPSVRAIALTNLSHLPPEERRKRAVPLLTDSSRTVRAEAARVLSPIERNVLRGREHDHFQAALEDYFASQEEANDRAGSHLAKGAIYENLGKLDEAEKCYRLAMRVEPNVTGPRSSLAALLDVRIETAQQEAQAAVKARDRERAVALMEPVAAYQVTAEELRRQELKLMERDVRLVPENGSLQYRYALLLYLHGRLDEAETGLAAATKLEPHRPDFWIAYALLLEKQSKNAEALAAARKASELAPDDDGFQETVARLSRIAPPSK